jgi:hypothetical protein
MAVDATAEFESGQIKGRHYNADLVLERRICSSLHRRQKTYANSAPK